MFRSLVVTCVASVLFSTVSFAEKPSPAKVEELLRAAYEDDTSLEESVKLPGIGFHEWNLGTRFRLCVNLLCIPDFFTSKDDFETWVAEDFSNVNIKQLVSDLHYFGFEEASVPKTAEAYREELYPLILKCIRRMGYIAVEVPVAGVPTEQDAMGHLVLPDASLELLAELKGHIEAAELQVCTVGMSGADIVESIRVQARVTKLLGGTQLSGPMFVPFGPHPGDESGPVRVEEVISDFVALVPELRKLGAYLEDIGVHVNDEPLNRWERRGLNRHKHVRAAVAAIGHQSFGYMIDHCHHVSESDPARYESSVNADISAGIVGHNHCSDVRRGRPYASYYDWSVHRPFVTNPDYKGFISYEGFDATLPFKAPGVVELNRAQWKYPLRVVQRTFLKMVHEFEKLAAGE